MALQDIPDGLVTGGISQMHQGTGHTIIPPAAILLG